MMNMNLLEVLTPPYIYQGDTTFSFSLSIINSNNNELNFNGRLFYFDSPPLKFIFANSLILGTIFFEIIQVQVKAILYCVKKIRYQKSNISDLVPSITWSQQFHRLHLMGKVDL